MFNKFNKISNKLSYLQGIRRYNTIFPNIQSTFVKPKDINVLSNKQIPDNESIPIYLLSSDDYKNLPFTISSNIIEDFNFELNKYKIIYSNEIIGGRAVLVGLGNKDKININNIRNSIYTGIKAVQSLEKISSIIFPPNINHLKEDHILKSIANTAVLSNYKFNKYITKNKKNNHSNLLKEISIVSTKKYHQMIKDEIIIAEETLFARNIGNERADVATPEYFEKICRDTATTYDNININVLDYNSLKKNELNILCMVGQAAVVPPRLVILTYNGNPEDPDNRTALVGKGITFDSGGLNLKPTGFIEDMHLDMCGAAAALGAIRVASKLKLKKNIISVLALAENAIDAKAMKPHTIVMSHKGLSVEIGNTDAEGRLILADALSYVQKYYQPKVIIDIATLTGACVVALGEYCAGLFSNSTDLTKRLQESGDTCFERCWPMPILPEHSEELKGTFSDLKSTGKSRYGGACTAAAFLQNFINKDVKWAHIDIAGPSNYSSNKSFIPKGATGFGVQLLYSYLKNN